MMMATIQMMMQQQQQDLSLSSVRFRPSSAAAAASKTIGGKQQFFFNPFHVVGHNSYPPQPMSPSGLNNKFPTTSANNLQNQSGMAGLAVSESLQSR
jgi:hypothetical protein